MNYKKLISSISTIAFVSALVVGGTGAFFSDVETSTANTFTAGAIDLTVDSEAHYNGSICQLDESTVDVLDDYTWQGGTEYPVGLPCTGTWEATDLGAETFFNFDDVKPGDEGENTISLHVTSNPAWACIDVDITKNDDVSSTEPELDGTGDVLEDGGDDFDGELAQNIKFAAWLDQGSIPGWQGDADPEEGDNIWQGEAAEPLMFSNQSGPASDVLGGVSYPLADSVTGPGPMTPDETNYIGLAWCAGDQVVDTNASTITCDGAGMGNEAQTDSMEASIAFRVEQSRNNENFVCAVAPPVVQRQLVGAVAYVAPVSPTCDITVDETGGDVDLDTIQEGIALATTGQTVCVEEGTYTGPIDIGKSVILSALAGPATTIIDGGIKITSSDVTVEGFTINAGVVGGEPNPVGFYVGTSDNVLIDSNVINGQVPGTGVLFVTGGIYNNVAVTNNEISGNNAGIYTNPHTGLIAIKYNDIKDNNAGIGGLMGATVEFNEFTHTILGSEAAGIDGSFDSNVATVNFNNFLDGVKLNDYGAIAVINAENNFFSVSGASQTTAPADFDFDPEEVAAFPHN